MEVLARRRDGTSFPATISLSFVEGGAESLVLTAIRDIGRKRTDELYLTAIVGLPTTPSLGILWTAPS